MCNSGVLASLVLRAALLVKVVVAHGMTHRKAHFRLTDGHHISDNEYAIDDYLIRLIIVTNEESYVSPIY